MTARMHEATDDLLSNFLASCRESADASGEDGLLRRLTKLLAERTLAAENAERVGDDRHAFRTHPHGGMQNRRSIKSTGAEFGEVRIDRPRAVYGNFEPQLVPMHLTRWSGFDDKILSLYARGMTVREIRSHLHEMYGADISPSLISSVTDAVGDEIKVWQARPLDPVYPIVYLECIQVKVREGAVRMKIVHLAIGVTVAGEKEVLGFWLAQTEDAKCWLQIMTELRQRGVQDILIACVESMKGPPEAIEAQFPQTRVQLCVSHMVRHSLNNASWKHRSKVAADLKRICTSADAEQAEQCLRELEARWDDELLPISQSWRRHWEQLIPFFGYPPEVRKVIYTTNAIEPVTKSVRRLTRNFGAFSSDEALRKLLYLVLRGISRKWTMPIRDWKIASQRFTVQFEGRLPPL